VRNGVVQVVFGVLWKKIRGNNWKVGKSNQAISQTPALGLGHDTIQTRWALNILSKSMLEKVWWCKHSEMEFLSEPFVARWAVQIKQDTRELEVVEDHMPPWGVVGKGRCCYQLVLRLQKMRDINQP
jgi:hypothetical protein